MPLVAVAVALAGAVACRRADRAAPAITEAGASSADTDVPEALVAFEAETRRAFDLAHPPSRETGFGADPWAIRRLDGSLAGDNRRGYLGILRGRSSLVLLDDALRELARVPAPRSTTGLAVTDRGEVLVTGTLSARLARYAVRGDTLVPTREVTVPGVTGLRDVAVTRGGATWVLDEREGQALRLGRDTGSRASLTTTIPVGHGATTLLATRDHLLALAVLEHAVTVIPLDAAGEAQGATVTLTNDGPLWSMDAVESGSDLLVAVGGVEDHPLDRRAGFFGFIDSFVYVFRVRAGKAERIAAVNVAEHGVVTPQAIAIEHLTGGWLDLLVTGYGSATAARLQIDLGTGRATPPRAFPSVPGARSVARDGSRVALADPLLDAWVVIDDRTPKPPTVVPVPDEAPTRDARTRLGEALFFTTLSAPGNTSDSSHSRFTCETCHFEGYVDGRTHHTGRGDVHATTKPLAGLAGNRPYFTRALDPDLATVAHAELRVAGGGASSDPFVDLAPADHPWLGALGVTAVVPALETRRALVRFLMDHSHRPNAAALGRTTFTPAERRGAEVFRDRCASCHAARLDASDAATTMPFARWEALVLSESAPLVWARSGYEKTGIEPYVHDEGARPTSLRRLARKWPYFTNGSSKTVEDVLARARVLPGGAFVHASASGTPLEGSEQRALAAFLELL